MKKKLYINAFRLFSLLAIVTLFVACDAHRDFPDTAMRPCHILCTDGKVLSVSDFKQSEKQPIAVVFHVNLRHQRNHLAYGRSGLRPVAVWTVVLYPIRGADADAL